jgi:hypothetical protein
MFSLRAHSKSPVFLFGALMSVCLLLGPGASADIKGPTPEWTILVFMNGKNNLEPDTLINFNQIASVGSSAAVHFLVELGRPNAHYPGAGSSWSGVRRFRVEKGSNIDSKPLMDLGNKGALTDMGKPEALTDFLNWGFEHYPAKHYMLVIWNHGQGYRFQLARSRNTREASLSREATQSALISMNGGKSPAVIGSFRSVSSDEVTGHILYNRQIQDALLALSQKGRNLDVIGFDACLMSMLETAYALRGAAQFMVASEELEPGSGWQYARWVKPLSDHPTISPKDLATLIVTSYKDEYQDYGQTTLANIDLQAVPAAAVALDTFAAALNAKLDIQRTAIAAARNKLPAFGSYYHVKGNGSIDLQSFLTAFSKATSDAALKQLSETAQKAIHGVIVETYASDQEKNWSPTGVAIYFPPTAKDFCADPNSSGYFKSNSLYPIEFVQTSDWATFVTGYLKVIPADAPSSDSSPAGVKCPQDFRAH